MLDFHNTISHKLWSVDEAQKSSSYRELKAVSLGLESFLPLLKGHTIKWYIDNQSVSRIVEVGSTKEDLQCLACVSLVCACSVASHWKLNGFRDRLMTELIFWAELWIMMIGGSWYTCCSCLAFCPILAFNFYR